MPLQRDDSAIEVRVLHTTEVERVGNALGLARLYQGDGFYLVAWQGEEPMGHLHLALSDPPELQDVQVASDHRRRGVAGDHRRRGVAGELIAAAERHARIRGFTAIRVGIGIDKRLRRRCTESAGTSMSAWNSAT